MRRVCDISLVNILTSLWETGTEAEVMVRQALLLWEQTIFAWGEDHIWSFNGLPGGHTPGIAWNWNQNEDKAKFNVIQFKH